MINHARTLLLNIPPSVNTLDVDGGEYMDPTYVPVAETTEVTRLRQRLFGFGLDAMGRNYRAAQYMSLLHADPMLSTYLVALDGRLTYDNRNWINTERGASIETIMNYSLGGTIHGMTDVWPGVSVSVIDINVYADTDALVTVQPLRPYAETRYYRVIGDGLADVPMLSRQQDTLGWFRWARVSKTENATVLPITATEASAWSGDSDGQWTVTIAGPPQPGLHRVADDVLKSGGANWSWAKRNTDPYKALHYMATHGENALRRLGAAVLLLILRNNEVMLGQSD